MSNVLTPGYDIKAIETFYNGVFYRSRLEARWAHFFNFLGLNSYYEHEGYQINVSGKKINYLPDFYIPVQTGLFSVSRPMFFEIKPTRQLTESEAEKYDAFAGAVCEKNCIFGMLREIPKDTSHFNYEHFLRYYDFSNDFGADNFHEFCACPFCRQISFEHSGRWDRIDCLCIKTQKEEAELDLKWIREQFKCAAHSALSLRFHS